LDMVTVLGVGFMAFRRGSLSGDAATSIMGSVGSTKGALWMLCLPCCHDFTTAGVPEKSAMKK
jgi:hypothetical protein